MPMQSIDRILHIVLILLDRVLMNLMSHILLMFQVMEFIVIPIVHMLLLLHSIVIMHHIILLLQQQ